MLRRLLLATLVLSAACASEPAAPIPVTELPEIDAAAVLGHIQRLASDEFEGRLPGTRGEALTVAYLVDQFKAIGAEPGNPDGTYLQKVPLVGLTPEPRTPFVVRAGGRTRNFAIGDEVVAFSKHVADDAVLRDSEIVFVGYGVQAPEYQWDDFKGLDVKGKTLLMLVNDPPVPDPAASGGLDAGVFGGKAMTYYGRWTYKYEKAAELGAAGVLVVHEEGPAGYPFSVVQSMGRERFDLVTPDRNMGRATIEGWISLDAATDLLKLAGLDFAALKAQAATREFSPVALGATASIAIGQKMRNVDSQNVVAKITGSDAALRDEFVVYTAHWDHLGVGTPVDGDAIYNGAMDNASGTAALVEMARAVTRLAERPKRTLVFLAVTAEEQGLLGSQYYAQFPLHPLDRTLAAINLDGMNMWGRTRDMVVIGLGMSELDDYLSAAAAEQGRVLVPDAEPEKGFYYRSDHFNFAKVGVPALNKDDGLEYIGKPEGYGREKRDRYTSTDYHAPSDEVKPDWDLSGLAEDARLLLAVGIRVANADAYPQWKPGSEFKAIREKMLGGRQ
jgi:Zn-dependent M28 family amino/carboxypeptidase